MNEYLEYLEKLNLRVDMNEIIFKSARVTVIKDRKRLWDWTFWLSLLAGILLIGGAIVTMVDYYYHQGTWLKRCVCCRGHCRQSQQVSQSSTIMCY